MTIHQPKIPSRSRKCCVCKAHFQPTMRYVSMLLEDKEDYTRFDYCENCWEKAERKQEATSSWHAAVPEKIEEKKESYTEQVFTLLRDRINTADAYLLALYLARNKKVIIRQELQKEEKDYQIFEVIETEEMLFVPKFPVVAEEIAYLQETLEQIRHGSNN